MHGIIFSELRKYVETKHSKETWNTLLRNAGLANKTYLPVQKYPDAEIVAIVGAAASITGLSESAVLEDFGEFLAPALMMFGHLLWAEWKTIDVIENTEGTVHSVVRVKNPGAQPPKLKAQRNGADEVVLVYTSPRQMCALAMGIGMCLGKHFNERIAVKQTTCMHQGAPQCEIVFRKLR
jgi:hypothetical protein